MAFIEKSYDLDQITLSIAIGSEDNTTDLEFNPNDLSEEMRTNLMLHGLSQKLGDATASVKKRLTDTLKRDPTEDEHKAAAIEAINAVWKQLESGDWRAARGEGEAKPRIGEVALAIARLRNMEVEEVARLVAATDKDKIKQWRKHPQIQAEITKIRAERAQERLSKTASASNFDPFA